MKKLILLKQFSLLIMVLHISMTSATAKPYTEIVKMKSKTWEVTDSTDAYLIPTNKGKISIYIAGLDKNSERILSEIKPNQCMAITRFDNNDNIKIRQVNCKK